MTMRKRRKKKPVTIAEQVDQVFLDAAQQAYAREQAEWDEAMAREEQRNAERLRDPVYAADLGLPPELPEHTIEILKRTMALDTLGPSMPQVDKVYRRYGVT